ncbi:hypothetical protein ACXWHK_004687 [Vibrio alginolyticus]|uniref:hypothetical protein n=1 Tax=Vibrio TaxID=662 RepID=UPI001F373069|nr:MULTISPECIES: hypothetical protein [Vibrio]MCS0084907.1 hypothetical protein [Vibrio alginolyticus]MDW1675200.1 hypothetical protein [Vibrio sp. Vb2610]MDW1807362.1 hypothetical protein [Vibrio sp. Vb2628]
MSSRDNFTQKTKDTLKDRAGNKCSFPSCRAPTSGASDESDESVDRTGMACHIFAAAPGRGARRYDPTMSSEERRSVRNGIWMCYKHGKQIDNDESRFTSEILQKWKEVAERRAQIENELGREIGEEHEHLLSLGLAAHNVSIDSVWSNENELIGDALKHSCVEAIWGKGLVSYLRSFIIEKVRNSFIHGGASSVKLEIDTKSVILIDDGDEFTPSKLVKHDQARGGAHSYKHLIEKYGSKVIPSTMRKDSKNITSFQILTSLDDLKNITPCSLELSYESVRGGGYELDVIDLCEELYITIPRYFALSDLYWLQRISPDIQDGKKELVFVLDEVADYVTAQIEQAYPSARVIDLSNC